MSLSPAYIGKPLQGVSEILNSKLLKYDSQFSGVLLSFSNVKLHESFGRVFDDVAEMQLRVKARGLVFAARKDMRLTGIVNQVTAGHVHLLVCGAFQVVIDLENIPSKYKYSSSLNHFESESQVVDVSSKILFKVIRIKDEGGPWYIQGSLKDDDLGPILNKT